MIQDILNNDRLQLLINCFPTTLYSCKKLIGLDKDEFIKYVCCPQCNKRFNYADATVVDRHGTKHSQLCNNVRFPNHPQSRMRAPCGTALMKEMVIDGASKLFYPYKVFTYQPLKVALQRLVRREDIIENLKRPIIENENYHDIYDGALWKNAVDCDGNLFFKDVRNLGGLVNVDWFQPFSNNEHSVGVIYLVVLNLSRDIRFKPENVVIVGIVPGPKEPELVINSFLEPFVTDLLELWEDVYLYEKHNEAMYRFTLLGTSSDLPATRKCCGFLSFNLQECSKCYKKFPRDENNRPNYSGYDMNLWARREKAEHVNVALKTVAATTLSSRTELESSSGVKYTELLRLPYFDPIRGHTVDPMHNLLLGTAKHTFTVWIQKGILNDQKIQKIDDRMQQLSSPSEVGRMSQSMSLYKSMKSDEWKNWVLYFSLFCLKDLIKRQHFNMWQVFVRACYIVINTSISKDELILAHQLLVLFCNTFQKLLGEESCTPNMHMHLHLQECILDYGPIYSFWCYSFERYNGILGNYHTNNHAITITLMRKFLGRVTNYANFKKLEVNVSTSLNEFGLQCCDLQVNVVLVDKLRQEKKMDLSCLAGTYQICAVPKLYCLDSDDMETSPFSS